MISTPELKFLDVLGFLAPGNSLDSYVKAYTLGKHKKGFYPYEYMTSYDKLYDTQLPGIRAFDSVLKNTKLKPEQYTECLNIWQDKGMTYLYQYLKYYNILDTTIFLQAVINQSKLFREEYGIYLFRDGITIPSIATSICWSYKPATMQTMYTPSEEVYKVLKQGILGVPAICFHRYFNAEKGTLLSNKHKYPVKSVSSRDTNGMYLEISSRIYP